MHWIKTQREMILLNLVVWVVAALLLSSLLNRVSDYRSQLARDLAAEQAYRQTLSLRSEVGEELSRILTAFDPEATPSAAEFVEGVDGTLRSLQLRPDVSSPITRQSDFFRFHSLQVVFRRSSLEDLVAFNQSLSAAMPLIGVESLSLSAFRNDPRQLDATFQLRAIELIPERVGAWASGQ